MNVMNQKKKDHPSCRKNHSFSSALFREAGHCHRKEIVSEYVQFHLEANAFYNGIYTVSS